MDSRNSVNSSYDGLLEASDTVVSISISTLIIRQMFLIKSNLNPPECILSGVIDMSKSSFNMIHSLSGLVSYSVVRSERICKCHAFS